MQTMEVDRRQRRRYDTGIASTYQLDYLRAEFDFRAIVVASPDGEMLLGSMSEPIGRALAHVTAAIGTGAIDAEQQLLNFRDEHLDSDLDPDLHVREIYLDGCPVFVGILARDNQTTAAAFRRTTSGLQRILATT